MGDRQSRDLLENADLVLAVGVIFSDLNSGFWTSELATEKLVEMKDLDVNISCHTYRAVPMSSLIPHLASLKQKKAAPCSFKEFLRNDRNIRFSSPDP